MRVSVIIAAYNVAQQIERALESLRSQTCTDWEVIVVDDASTDGTPFAVHAIAEVDRRVRLICQDVNQGPAAARNRGIDNARGEWIAVLDADDAWRPERLERLLAVADRTDADYIADNLILFDDHHRCESGIEFTVRDEIMPFTPTEMFALDNPWKYGILKPLIRRSVLEEMGLRYNETLRFGEDLLLTAEVLFRGARGVLTREGYYLYTTPVGHLSRQRSSGTRSTTSLESLMWITDVLEARYGQSFNPQISRGLARCRQRIRQRLVAREITRLRQTRSLAALAAYLVGHPRGAVRYLMTSRVWGRAFGQGLAG
jgi:succinoglycan biosynthesis protein ExoO